MSSPLVYEKIEGDVVEYSKEYFEFCPKYVKCKGFVLSEYFENIGDKIRQMEVRPDDVWICSFPKTGTTWTQEMVWCIANNMDLEAAKEPLSQRFPFLELSTTQVYHFIKTKRPDMKSPGLVGLLNSVSYVNELSSPRFIKSHLPFPLLPEKLQQNTTKAKIVYVARNSRDTCISYYHFYSLMFGYKGDLESFCQLFLNDTVTYGPFWEHILGYWQQKDNPNVLFLTYEEMKKDLRQVIRRTAKFLGKALQEEQVEKLADHLSFENMKNNPAVNYESAMVPFRERYNLANDIRFMRCGKVGQWKGVMSQDMVEQFEKWDQKHLKNFSDYPVVSNYL